MAAKQGTLAQLSASAEDAKRAVLSRTGVTLSSPWFSNLNTVCTIKSAPPRSPDVLQMLGTKSGWLYKRNEQHVWQARWCCVVPHTFLYYFDAPAVVIPGALTAPTASEQEDWNQAVTNGLGNRKPHEKRYSLFQPHHPNSSSITNTAANSATSAAGADANNTSTDHVDASLLENTDETTVMENLQPAGIIDLECYSTIHRSTENPAVLELAGDEKVNPDLRAFYFCSTDRDEADDWTAALLQNRHSSLCDEVDAYKQVADGFASQLQLLHSELDTAGTEQEQLQQELYNVRSAAEETRRTAYRIAEECSERNVNTTTTNTTTNTANTATPSETTTNQLQDAKNEFRRNVETVRQQDLGVGAAVRCLADYIGQIEDLCAELQISNTQLRSEQQESGMSDQAALQNLQADSKKAAAQHAAEKEQLLQQLAAAQASSQSVTKELQDVQKDLSSTKMEVTMLMSSQRNKLATEKQHKKILKKEVIDLRQKVEDVVSEHSSLQHEHEKLKLVVQQERSKSDLLSRYVDKMESQVHVQQNMMEMMSQAGSVYAGGGSVYGGGAAASVSNLNSNNANEFTPNRRNNNNNNLHRENTVEEDGFDDDGEYDVDNDDDDDDDCFENNNDKLLQPPPSTNHRRSTKYGTPHNSRSSSYHQHNNDMDDNKSHVSELTEDRTQRELTALQFQHHHHQQHHGMDSMGASPRQSSQARFRKKERLSSKSSPRRIQGPPPSVIIGVKKNETSTTEETNNDNNDDDNNDQLNTSNRSSMSNNNTSTPNKDEDSGVASRKGLDTINNSTGSIHSGAFAAGGATPPVNHRRTKHIPRGSSGGRDSVSVSSADQTLDSVGKNSTSTKKLSVAQRARLEAERGQTTPVRARLDEKTESALIRSDSSGRLAATLRSPPSPPPSATREQRHQQQQQQQSQTHHHHHGRQHHHKKHDNDDSTQRSGLWRRVEDAVLGPRFSDEESLDNDDDGSIESTRVTDYTEEDRAKDDAKRRFRHRDAAAAAAREEKKSSDCASISNLSLQERSQLQRNKQLRFLREQGLIKDETDVPGGAGADSVSVTSSSASPSKATPTRRKV